MVCIDIEIDLVQHVEQYEDPPPQPNPQPPPPNPLLPIQPAPKVQMPYAELYAQHPRATEIMTTLWLLEFIMDLCFVDTCTLFQEPIRLSHLLHAGIRTLFMLGKSPTFLSWYPDAARRLHMPDAAAILNAAAVGCQLFLPLYLLAVARARAARSDRIGWVAIMQSVCSHVVGIGFLYHQAFHPKNWAGQIASDPATVLKLVALGGTWWSVILYLWAAFKAAAFLAVEYNSLKMRVAASRRGDSGLTTAERMAIHEQLQLHPLVIGIYVLSLLLQAVLCVVAFHAPKIFRRHFLKTQGSFLFSEWLAWIAMKAIHPTMISCWRVRRICTTISWIRSLRPTMLACVSSWRWHAGSWRRRVARVDFFPSMTSASSGRGTARRQSRGCSRRLTSLAAYWRRRGRRASSGSGSRIRRSRRRRQRARRRSRRRWRGWLTKASPGPWKARRRRGRRRFPMSE